MILYSFRRLLYLIPLLLGVCLFIFIVFNVVATDPAVIMLGKNATAKQINEVREQMGLNRPWIVQYFDVVKSAFTMNFGRSWYTKQDITEMIMRGAGPSLSVTLPAFVFSTIFSLLVSLVVAYYRGGKIDLLVRSICVGLVSISSLAYILLFQYLLAFKWGLFEISGYEFGFPHFLPYIILPCIIWIILSLGPDIRYFRTIVLDELYQDYVRTARAKGLSEIKVMIKHVLRNALIPVITYVVIQIPFLILGALLLESFFSIPGLGGTVLTAVNNSDFPVIKAFTILSAIAYILFNLITDLLYAAVDPRVKLE
ncbi:MAG: ABC transporter permease [Bacteriovoracaceae bacterium]|nr:ABC transporter permease [Bacteriovoracaceae bacterium]